MSGVFDDETAEADAADRARGRNDTDLTHLDKDAKTRLVQVVSRLESIADEKASLGERSKELLAEAKGQGLDPKIIRAVLKRRKMDRDALEQFDTLVELYMGVFG